MRSFSFVMLVILLFSCSNKPDKIDLVEYEGGEQLLNLNDLTLSGRKIDHPSIKRISDDSVLAGEELLAKIFLEEPDWKLVNAFYGCLSVANPAVDTSKYSIRGCATRLLIQSDTIMIGFRPTKIGLQNFPEITILTRHNDKVFRIYNYSFQYRVVGKQR